jgi:hypothetical protein
MAHGDCRADCDSAAIGIVGGTNVVDHVAEDGSKTIAITFDVDDVGTVTATHASPPAELAEVSVSLTLGGGRLRRNRAAPQSRRNEGG